MKKLKFKTKKRKIIFLSLMSVVLVIGCATAVVLSLLSRIEYSLVDNPVYEVQTSNSIASLFSEIKHGVIEDADAKLDTDTVGQKNMEVTLRSEIGTEEIVNLIYNVNDTTKPTIDGDDELSFETTEDIDILSNFKAEDNSKQKVELSVAGDYDLEHGGEYKITIIARDESGNESSKDVTLKITEPIRPVVSTTASSSSGAPYYIEVNRQQNVVIVYSKDQNGNYSNIAKVFVASTGAPDSPTPLGTYTVSDRYETLLLVGNVWGHYTVRINGPYFFHSVPYFTKGDPWDNLEYLEYNKLGNGASAGCVRLATIDAKWIYDNIGYGTTVKIYDSPNLPDGVVKPSAIKIDENSQNRGWDPTDPDPRNPWL